MCIDRQPARASSCQPARPLRDAVPDSNTWVWPDIGEPLMHFYTGIDVLLQRHRCVKTVMHLVLVSIDAPLQRYRYTFYKGIDECCCTFTQVPMHIYKGIDEYVRRIDAPLQRYRCTFTKVSMSIDVFLHRVSMHYNTTAANVTATPRSCSGTQGARTMPTRPAPPAASPWLPGESRPASTTIPVPGPPRTRRRT